MVIYSILQQLEKLSDLIFDLMKNSNFNCEKLQWKTLRKIFGQIGALATLRSEKNVDS